MSWSILWVASIYRIVCIVASINCILWVGAQCYNYEEREEVGKSQASCCLANIKISAKFTKNWIRFSLPYMAFHEYESVHAELNLMVFWTLFHKMNKHANG